MTPSQPAGPENIVHSCIESASNECGLPGAVVRRLIGLVDDLAVGALSASQGSQLFRRIEQVVGGYDATD